SWYAEEFALGADDRCLLLSSFSFDLTQKNLYVPFLLGGELHLADYDPSRLVAAIAAAGVTWVNCTPSAFYPLAEEEAWLGDLAPLRWVFLGGEPIALSRLDGWLRRPECRAQVVNTYGPTECTDVVAYHRVARAARPAAVPIGQALPNVALW